MLVAITMQQHARYE